MERNLNLLIPDPKDAIIEGIAFAEFHVEQGPIIVLDYPGPCDSAGLEHLHKHFGELNKLIIPRTEFCGHFITVTMDNYVLAGYPVEMKDEAYFRQKVEINLFFVVEEKNFRIFSKSIEESITKLAHYLVELEYRSHSIYNEEAYGSIKKLCKTIYDGFIMDFECSVLENDKMFMLRLYPNEASIDESEFPEEPIVRGRKIHDLLCPSLVKNCDNLVRYYVMRDLSFFKVINEIDGTKSIHSIGVYTEMPKRSLYFIISTLFYNKMIVLTDLLLFSNVYCLNPPKAMEFISDPEKMSQLYQIVQTGQTGEGPLTKEAFSVPSSGLETPIFTPNNQKEENSQSNSETRDFFFGLNPEQGEASSFTINQDFKISVSSESLTLVDDSETHPQEKEEEKEPRSRRVSVKIGEFPGLLDAEFMMWLLSFFNGKDSLGTILLNPKVSSVLEKVSIVRFLHFLNSVQILKKLYYYPFPPIHGLSPKQGPDLINSSEQNFSRGASPICLSDFSKERSIEEVAVKKGYGIGEVLTFLEKNNYILIPKLFD